MKRRILALIAILALSLTMFTACKSEPEVSEPESSPAQATAEPTAAPEPTAEPTPAPAVDLGNTNLLTGLPTLTDGAVGKRPVAVMVNNVDAALPQYGISAADVIFEMPVEGDQTRLMAMYGDYTQIPEVCSIRSCRYYYPILAVGFDAIYVHWGLNESLAAPVVNQLDIDRFDALEFSAGAYFGRDQDRLNSGYALEHTGVFHGENFPKLLEERETRTDLKEGKQGTAFQFVEKDTVKVPEGQDAGSVYVEFGANNSTFNYDPETHAYLKQFKTQPHMDAVTGEQLAFENVVVLETDIHVSGEGELTKIINWQGGEGFTGIYVSEGKAQNITWSKADEYSPLKFFDESGKEIEMNRGKTYIAFTYFDNYSITA